MSAVFADDRKRKINLGGASTASSRDAILNQVQAQRNERYEQKKRQENAVMLQSWWRGVQEARKVRKSMRRTFEEDIYGINALRCLVIIGRRDEDALAMWSSRMVESGPDVLFAPARQPELRTSWLVLVRQICLSLVFAVSKSPHSPYAIPHLKILSTLLSVQVTEQFLGIDGEPVTADITQYLLHRNFYPLLARAINGIPLESRTAPSLSLLIPLTTFPFKTFSTRIPEFGLSLTSFFASILTVPLLVSRLPAPSLIHLASEVPFADLRFLDITPFAAGTVGGEDRVHLLATLQALVPPRYKLLSSDTLSAYFHLVTTLLNTTPISILNPPSRHGQQWVASEDSDSDSDSHTLTRSTITVSVVSSFNTTPLAPRIPPPDPRTLKRLSSLPTPAHINSLLSCSTAHTASAFPSLINFLLALSVVWPAVLSTILASGAGLLREVYKGLVRGSILGKDAEPAAGLTDPQHVREWPALLLLADLYTQTLKTMGDDEFFGTSGTGTSSSVTSPSTAHVLGSSSSPGIGPFVTTASTQAQRNPLTLDELKVFSRQLLNVAFALYWWDDGMDASGIMSSLVGAGEGEVIVRCTWEAVREKVTKCLVGIHARDSRKPFLPLGHFFITSHIDVRLFVEAAIFEEREFAAANPRPGASRRSFSSSKKQLPYLSPRLGVLNNIPFALPFEVRVSIFQNFVLNDAMQHADAHAPAAMPINPRAFLRNLSYQGASRTKVQIRRGNVAQDGFDKLAEADLKGLVEIAFIDQFGIEEMGIDGGGVFKEFFTSLCKEVFDTDRGLWLANKKNELYPNPHAYAKEGHSLNWYRFIGRILGKAMYEGILVDVAFAGFFLAKWLGRQSFLDDLASLDPDLYNGLIFLKHYNGNLEDLALNFTVAVEDFGVAKAIDLVTNGSNIAVTRENRLQYIYLMSHFRLRQQIKSQSEAFFEGLSEMIDPRWIRMFNQQEMQVLLGGVNAPVDFDDLRKNTYFGGLYDDNHPTIVAFWNVVNSFNQEQRMALLRGFKELIPNFSIRDAGPDKLRLPTASTCVNLLKLPPYDNEKSLRDKLLQAITSNAGFDLS